MVTTLRQRMGCWVHERWRTECALSPLGAVAGISWRDLCNRNERLGPGSDAAARVCLWPFSSMLTVARVFPRVGGRLLRHVAREWPFAIDDGSVAHPAPRVSVVIPVGGRDRRPQFQAVVKSFAAQSERALEIVAVEHARVPEYEDSQAAGVRYLHLDRNEGQAFNKSRALNAGARAARGKILVLHDGDIVVPRDFVRSVVERVDAGYEGLQPLRFLFYLEDVLTRGILEGRLELPRAVPTVGHNFPGGSTIATTDAYWGIGGSDERFDERGGDDNDFLGRLKTRRFFHGGYLPALHLWHPTDPTFENSPRMKAFKRQQLAKPAEERIAELIASAAR